MAGLDPHLSPVCFVFQEYFLKNLILLCLKIIYVFIFLNYFDMLILKIIFLKIKKYYFNIFLNKNYF